jgi:hypothetical protein
MKTEFQEGMADWQKQIDARPSAANAKMDDLFGTRAFLKNDYLARATGAQMGIGANSKEEAQYPIYEKDSTGQSLDGSKGYYTLRFAKDQFPPVNAFWSLTMYNLPQQLLVKNPMKLDIDGGLTIYIHTESPGKDKESSWLPAPNVPFMLAMRYYLPKAARSNGEWKSPVVEHIK